MAINHAETSIIIDGVDTHNMSDDSLLATHAKLRRLLLVTPHCGGVANKCYHCEKREIQLDIADMELEARGLSVAKQEQGQAV
jgi:hypothetical protein